MFFYNFKKFTATKKNLVIFNVNNAILWSIEVVDGSRITCFSHERFIENKKTFKSF